MRVFCALLPKKSLQAKQKYEKRRGHVQRHDTVDDVVLVWRGFAFSSADVFSVRALFDGADFGKKHVEQKVGFQDDETISGVVNVRIVPASFLRITRTEKIDVVSLLSQTVHIVLDSSGYAVDLRRYVLADDENSHRQNGGERGASFGGRRRVRSLYVRSHIAVFVRRGVVRKCVCV